MKAVIVDKDYGSVTPDEVEIVKKAFGKAGIELIAAHYVTEEEIIEKREIMKKILDSLFEDN